ncbi:hypothetical protein PTKIN_Ptkin15bG0098800 [Pterospermum kingtungense]
MEDSSSSIKTSVDKRKEEETNELTYGQQSVTFNRYPNQHPTQYSNHQYLPNQCQVSPYYKPYSLAPYQFPYQALPYQSSSCPNPLNPSNNSTPSSEDQTYLQKSHPKESKFDPIPVSYTELYPQLLQSQLVAPIQGLPRKPPFPKWYDVNARCEYHMGISGHSLENCIALKKKVQELLKSGRLRL